MKQFKFLSVLLVALLIATTIFAQFTRQQAIDLILNDVLSDELDNIDVYASFNSFSGDAALIDNDNATNPYAESWVFYVNDSPFASWYHPCRYIFVNTSNGNYSTVDKEIYPQYLSTDFEEISSANRPDPIVMDGTAFVPDPQKVESNYNYALIISAIDDVRNISNVSLIFNVLTQNYNYKEENIIVLYSYDGHNYSNDWGDNLNNIDPEDDIDGPATWATIQQVITEMKGEEPNPVYVLEALGHGDQLAVFFTGVPVNTSGIEPMLYFPTEDQIIGPYPVSGLSEPMEDIDCGQMIFTFDVNSASEIIPYFIGPVGSETKCFNRYLFGSTGNGEKNQAEWYITGGLYSEQIYYWAAAVRGLLPEPTAPWNTLLGFTVGEIDFGLLNPVLTGHTDYQPDLDADGYIQMDEAFIYACNENTGCNYPDNNNFYLPITPGTEVNPSQTDEFPFVGENVLTLAGLSGLLISSANLPERSYIIADSLKVSGNLTFAEKSEIYIHRNRISDNLPTNARLIIEATGTLEIGENCLVANFQEFSPVWAFSAIVVYGDEFIIGEQTHFYNINFSMLKPEGIEYFTMKNIYMENGMARIGNSQNTLIENCTFENVNMWGLATSHLQVSDNEFNKTHTIFSGVDRSSYINLLRNEYEGVCEILFSSYYTCNILNYPKYVVDSNNLTNCLHGIYIYYSGHSDKFFISNNIISNCSDNGLSIYASAAKLANNKIFENDGCGVKLLDHTHCSVQGNPSATYVYQTQEINNNGLQEIYTDQASFPLPINYNAIYDNLSPSDYLLYCELPVTTVKDVRNNFWGDNFYPNVHLYPTAPSGLYLWYPVFELSFEEQEKSDAQLLYESATAQFESGGFSLAMDDYKQVVEEYPETNYAKESLKMLFSAENSSNAEFISLKQYYETNSTILNDSVLAKIAGFLANKCDVELQNWAEAVAWYENVILNPPAFADSIYAIIDLGHLYQLMELNGYKSAYTGSMPQYVPVSDISHMEYTHYLLSLLPGDQPNNKQPESTNTLKPGELLQNAPNPFAKTTQIWYKLQGEAIVTVNVFDYTGKKIRSNKLGVKPEGIHSFHFSADGLSSGIYFYSLEINGQVSDSKKLTIIK
ncbi:MAG: right-handed parallel beta-helix repeat-containing protein [Bacteroidales bacterium]